MNWKENDLAALHEFEAALNELWRKHPDMTDHVADERKPAWPARTQLWSAPRFTSSIQWH